MTPAALAALHARCLSTPRPWTAAEFAALLADASVFLCTRPQGFALGRVVAGEAELLTLAVAPEARRRGTGTALLDAFQARALALGARTAHLEVAASNTAARALYLAAGWTETGRRPRYFRCPDGTREDALILSRALAAGGAPETPV